MAATLRLAREVAVPEPNKGYKDADYSVSMDVRNGNVSLSISVRPYRVLADGTRRPAPDILHQSISWSSYCPDPATKRQSELVEAVARAVEAVVAEA